MLESGQDLVAHFPRQRRVARIEAGIGGLPLTGTLRGPAPVGRDYWQFTVVPIINCSARMRTVIECVPNISEGRDRARVEEIAAAVRAVPGVRLLDVSSDASHNRSVLTLVGDAAGVAAAMRALFEAALPRIDLTKHRASIRAWAPWTSSRSSRSAARRSSSASRSRARSAPRSPSGSASRSISTRTRRRSERRRNLADIRKGEFEGFAEKMKDAGVEARLRAGPPAPDRRRRRRRRARAADRLQHQPRNAGSRDRRPHREGDPPHRRRVPLREGDGRRARRPRPGPGLDQHDELPEDAAPPRLRVRPLRGRALRRRRSSAPRSSGLTPADALFMAAEHYLRIENFSARSGAREEAARGGRVSRESHSGPECRRRFPSGPRVLVALLRGPQDRDPRDGMELHVPVALVLDVDAIRFDMVANMRHPILLPHVQQRNTKNRKTGCRQTISSSNMSLPNPS